VAKEPPACARNASCAVATICLDPGHGGADTGAARDELVEKDLALDVALAARDALRREHRVVLTRDADRALTLAERRGIADAAAADLFVSLHVNAAGPQARGFEAFVRPWHDIASLTLAGHILEAIAGRFPDRRNRGIRQAALGVLRQPRPACLVECFFLSNPEDRALLARRETRAALGVAIADGCDAFLAGPALTTRRASPATANKGRRGRPAARSPRRPAPPPA